MARWSFLLLLGLTALILHQFGTTIQAQNRGPSIGFRNDAKVAVIVQGATDVKGMQRRGQPLLIQPGKTSYDTNLPAGDRFITIYDANQPSKVLHRSKIPLGKVDLFFAIRPGPGNPPQIILVPDKAP